MKINIDYKMDIEKVNKEIKSMNVTLREKKAPEIDLITDIDKHYSELTLNYTKTAVTMKYKDGLESQFRRIYGRIERKFDEAIDRGVYEIELEAAEKDFITKAFEEAKFPTDMTKYICIYEDEFIDKLKEK